MTRPPRIPPGVRPLSKSERKRIRRDNDRALFPSVVVQRLLATCDELERQRIERRLVVRVVEQVAS